MSALSEFVEQHVQRGDCTCGQCIDAQSDPKDLRGHTVDMVFFRVAPMGEPSADLEPDADEFRKLTGEHDGEFRECDPFDGQEHSYIELGAWIGDQGLAMQYMALGVMLKQFRLLSPYTMFGADLPPASALQFAGGGLLSVKAA